jgi:hypothetical protein
MPYAMRTALFVLSSIVVAFALGCGKGNPDPTPWCTDDALFAGADAGATSAPPTYYQDIKPIVDAKCAYCHVDGGIAPMPLTSYADVAPYATFIRRDVSTRKMPPWVAARCCTDYTHDWSLTPDEVALFTRWIDAQLPIGDAAHPAASSPLLGLSRVDVTATMKDAYAPTARPGTTDDFRCFVLDWDIAGEAFVTGVNPVPGVRSIVHHLVIEAVTGDTLEQAEKLDGADGIPGFDCSAGFGDFRDFTIIGGGLIGGDFPDGLGVKVKGGSKILLNVHYSMANAPPAPDKTSIQLKVDASANAFKGIAAANPAWLVDDAMRIRAGDPDAIYFYTIDPWLFTGGKKVRLRSAEAHMHYFGSKFVLRIIHSDGSRECLLEIPKWNFGWEQPFWFAQPKTLEPGDQIYVECHFDNSAAHQPNQQPPRDIAWGDSNQDMCAGFLSFTEDG